MRYFYKRNLHVTVTGPAGKPLPFTPLAHLGDGVLATEDPALIKACEDFIKRRVGGVRELTLQDYENVKKNLSSTPPLRQLPRPLQSPRAFPGRPPVADALAAVVAEIPSIPASQIFREEAAQLLRARPPRAVPVKSKPANVQHIP